MGVWDFLRFWRGRRIATDPAIDAVARTICANLRAMGLHVAAQPYKAAFVEIRASTAASLVTTPGEKDASGLALLLAGKFDPPALVFEQINSVQRGLGRAMVAAAMEGLRAHPGVFACVKVNDLSPLQADGRRWWEHVADGYADFDWRITHDPDAPHWPARGIAGGDIARSADFLRKREKLETLAREFGHDPGRVTLSPTSKVFHYLNQSFASEGEATPDGRVTIYYDPAMSDARLGCCLAHELQHLRYFAVRAAYLAEPLEGPLHRRFARFTPELLAARRGVSSYSNEHWDAWRGARQPRLFSDELAEGGSEPINETIAEVAKALYNWGPAVRIDQLWRELQALIDETCAALDADAHAAQQRQHQQIGARRGRHGQAKTRPETETVADQQRQHGEEHERGDDEPEDLPG